LSKATTEKPRLGIYAGSFDPFTLGHFDVVKRSLKIFDTLLIAVGKSGQKAPLFTVEERVDMISTVCKDLGQLKIMSFEGLAVDFARQQKATALVRGLRTETDFIYELQMALMNRALFPDLETVFIPTSNIYSHISSTLVREIASYHGNLSSMVHPLIAKKLADKFRR